MTQPVYIVAVGARCPVGLTAESAAAAVRAGISRISEHPFLVDSRGEKVLCAIDPRIEPTLTVPERLCLLTRAALNEIHIKLKQQCPLVMDMPVLLTLPETRPGFQASERDWLQLALASESSCLKATQFELIGEGHAGALRALSIAVERISNGHAEAYIVGGTDTYLEAQTLKWLEDGLFLARTGVRSGFAPGEASAMLAVASDAACRRFGLRPLALLRGAGCAQERRSTKSSEGLLGEALTEAVVKATKALRLPQDRITDVYCDINGERSRSDDWGFTLLRESKHFLDGTEYVSPVGQCGDVGAATGAFGCVLAVQAWRRQYAKGTCAMVWAGSWGGLRGAAVLERAEN
jgi:3-oxoacyl-[acyl-carrier-protein] synthase-1